MMVMVTVMEMEGGGEGTRCHQLGMGEQRGAAKREARRGCSCPTLLKGRQRDLATRVQLMSQFMRIRDHVVPQVQMAPGINHPQQA